MSRPFTPPGGCPVTLALVAVIALVWIAQGATGDALARLGLLHGPSVQAGQWWRLASSGFLHGSLVHVGVNAFMLYALGQQLARGVGSARFALVLAGALFGGSLAVMLFGWERPTLGASGMLMGVAAAFAVAVHAGGGDVRRHPVFGLVVLNLALPLLVPVISFWGHLGGAAGGALLAWLTIAPPRRVAGASRGAGGGETTLATGLAAVVALALGAALAGRLGGLL